VSKRIHPLWRALPVAALWLSLAPVAAAGHTNLTTEEARVARLQFLLRDYYTRQERAGNVDAEGTVERRPAAAEPAPAHAGQRTLLSGADGSLVLAEFNRRLSDPALPESGRDVAPICSIRTYLYGNLIAGEQRSFQPVGKYQYLLKQHLQPGVTTVKLPGHSWELHVPEDSQSQEYLLTLYQPPGEEPRLHAFPLAELRATRDAHIPPWLADDLDLHAPG